MTPLEIIVKGNASQANAELDKTKTKLVEVATASKKTESSFSSLKEGANKIAGALHNSVIEATGEAGEKIKELGEAFKEGGLKALAFGAAAIAASYIFTKGAEAVVKDFTTIDNSIEKQKKIIEEYKKIVDSVTESVGKETTETIGLLAVLNNETETRKRKLDAIKDLQEIQPDIFKGLKLEKDAVVGLDAAYAAYLVNLRNIIAAKIIQAQIEAKVTELLTIQGAANTKAQQAQLENLKNLIALNPVLAETKRALQDTKLAGGFLTDKQTAVKVAGLTDEIKGLFEKLTEFSKTIKVKEIKVKPEKLTVEKPDLLPKVSDVIDFGPGVAKLTAKPDLTIIPNVKEVIITDEAKQKVLDGIQSMFDAAALQKFQEQATAAVAQTLSNIMQDSISTAADAIGDALAGGQDVVPKLFDGLIKGIGSQIKELGKYLVKAGIEMLAAKKAIKALGLTPQTAIIAGIALEVLGAVLIAAATKKSNNVGFATGTRNSPSGSFLVGERGPERIFLPAGSAVQPNNELQAYGGSGITLQPSIQYSADGFRIMLNRTDARWSRNN